MSESEAGRDPVTFARVENKNWVSDDECRAMRLLHRDGWDATQLAFALERKTQTVRNHLKGDCPHEEVDDE